MTDKPQFVSPFEKKLVRRNFQELLLKRRLAPMSAALRDKTWLERARKEAPKEDEKGLVRNLTRTHKELEKQYLKLQTARLKQTQGQPRFAHAMARHRLPNQPFTSPEYDLPWSHFGLFECYQTGVQPFSAIGDPGIGSIYVAGGSTESHTIFQRLDLPAALQFEINLNDVTKWWRWDAADWVWLVNDVYFLLPPSPCDGRLAWQTDADLSLHNFSQDAEWVGFSVAAESNVFENSQAPNTSGATLAPNVFPWVSGGPDLQVAFDGPIVHFGSAFDVRRGQQSLIVLTLGVFLSNLDGRTEVSGTVGFHDSLNPGFYNAAAGVRYTFAGN